jgi:3-phenylpropionate/trans-cinnamate dioxygenase ferredoxin reductase component
MSSDMTPDQTVSRVVVVGAGHGGTRFAALLRQKRFAGDIVVLGAERDLPYERPPLSKHLLGEELREDLLPAAFYPENGIDLRRGVQVSAIDPTSRTVHTTSGPVGYDRLVLATGATPRLLEVPGATLPGVQTLRTLADARAIEATMRRARRVAVVGGGWIGLEIAAAARAADVEVVVLEQADRLLARVASDRLSAFLSRVHHTHGIVTRLAAKVTSFVDEAGRLVGVELADGSTVECDVAIVGIGAVPEIRLAREAGLECRDGIVVDSCAATSHPDIYAIGDATARPLPGVDGHLRLESIPSATEQARQAVASIVGDSPPAAEVPWFWSDQFGLKIRLAGLRGQGDAEVVREGTDELAVFHVRGDRLAAVETVGSPAAFTWGRKHIGAGTPISIERLGDPAVPLRDVVTAAA